LAQSAVIYFFPWTSPKGPFGTECGNLTKACLVTLLYCCFYDNKLNCDNPHSGYKLLGPSMIICKRLQ
jgi:hypothetical protein